MKTKFCDTIVREYEQVAREKTDRDLQEHLFAHYPTLNAWQRADPQYRKWRRCVIVELLHRGLIDVDPGPNTAP